MTSVIGPDTNHAVHVNTLINQVACDVDFLAWFAALDLSVILEPLGVANIFSITLRVIFLNTPVKIFPDLVPLIFSLWSTGDSCYVRWFVTTQQNMSTGWYARGYS